ncbi:family 6 glucosyltransferase [Chitinophaga caseinilytica]|uniref:family 6 glucosyltransferase n=1 Tax=Chitinophaga caseinilytica TaxID=2267521 RepID=UPI003C2BC1E7
MNKKYIKPTPQPRIAILYICTGKYTVFWKDFFKSTEQHFLTGCKVEYFVFTDGDIFPVADNVTIVECDHLGWPAVTLLRYAMFCGIEDVLMEYDYLFFMNANLIINQPFSVDILPVSEELLGVIHPGFYNKNRSEYTYESNDSSTAYLSADQGAHYYMGGFYGGKSLSFLKMSRQLKSNIEIDLKNGIIAVWHDESHLNKYFWDNKDILKTLDPSYGYPENWILPFKKRILIRDKMKFGGHNYLRCTHAG